MIGYIILLIGWSLLIVCLGLSLSGKNGENRIEKLERRKQKLKRTQLSTNQRKQKVEKRT